jgi:hypothetical protein
MATIEQAIDKFTQQLIDKRKLEYKKSLPILSDAAAMAAAKTSVEETLNETVTLDDSFFTGWSEDRIINVIRLLNASSNNHTNKAKANETQRTTRELSPEVKREKSNKQMRTIWEKLIPASEVDALLKKYKCDDMVSFKEYKSGVAYKEEFQSAKIQAKHKK